jgi:hypothetical protein
MKTIRKNAVMYFAALVLTYFFYDIAIAKALELQTPLAARVQAYNGAFKQEAPFKISSDESVFSYVKKGTVLSCSDEDVKKLFTRNAPAIILNIPFEGEKSIELELVKADIGGDYINVRLKGSQSEKIQVFAGLHYRGIIKGKPNSYAAVSIHENSISGIISNGNGNMVINPLKNSPGKYLFYNDQDLVNPQHASCATSDNISSAMNANGYGNHILSPENTDDCKVLKCFYECDYYTYNTSFAGNATNLTNFVTSAFNQVASLYFNISAGRVLCEISEISIMTTPASDYLLTLFPLGAYSGDIFNYLPSIIAHDGSSFNGDIAQFISTRYDIHPSGAKGLAAVIGALCNKYAAHSMVNFFDTSPVVIYPAYSENVEIMAHEMGHILGSPHTHACFWNGNNTPIDGCHIADPNCWTSVACSSLAMPTTPGTVMSYCSTTGGPGVDFSLGFGPQPGALIYNKVSSATCLEGSRAFVPTHLTSDPTRLSWTPVPGALLYTLQYKLKIHDGCDFENQWVSISGISPASYNYMANAPLFVPGSVYIWRVKADCSPYSQVCDPLSTFSILPLMAPVPTKFKTYDLTTHSATLCWDKCCSTFDLRYKESTGSMWTTLTGIPDNYYRFADIFYNNSTWQWQVSCAGTGNWSPTQTFTTPVDAYTVQNTMYNSPPLYSNNLCAPADASVHYITAMSMGGHTNSSGGSGSGYGDYRTPVYFDNSGTNIYGDIWRLTNYYRVQMSTMGQKMFIAIFIDWNRDGDYFDEGEDVVRFYGIVTASSIVNGPCTMPSAFTPGWTNIRIMAEVEASDLNAYVIPHQMGFNGVGEIEDYLTELFPSEYCQPTFRLSLDESAEVEIYPNPASEQLTVSVPATSDAESHVARIYDCTGLLVKQVVLSNGVQTLDVSALASGVYYMAVSHKDKTIVNKRFIKL